MVLVSPVPFTLMGCVDLFSKLVRELLEKGERITYPLGIVKVVTSRIMAA